MWVRGSVHVGVSMVTDMGVGEYVGVSAVVLVGEGVSEGVVENMGVGVNVGVVMSVGACMGACMGKYVLICACGCG